MAKYDLVYRGKIKRFKAESQRVTIYLNQQNDIMTMAYTANKLYTRNVQGFFIPEADLLTQEYCLRHTIDEDNKIEFKRVEVEKLYHVITLACIEACGTSAKDITFKADDDTTKEWSPRAIAEYIVNEMV